MKKIIVVIIGLASLSLVVIVALGIFLLQSFRQDTIEFSSECTSVELYDDQTGECYYECDTDEQCAAIEAQIDAELNSVFETTTTKIGSNKTQDPTTEQSSSGEPSEDTFAADSTKDSVVYAYINGNFSPAIQDAEQSKYTNIFMAIATKQFADTYLNQVSFFKDQGNDTAASVAQNTDNQTKWDLEINMAYANDEKEMLMTLVHEYAHIYSLNTSQVNVMVTGACPALALPEGCSMQDSHINDFQSQFWQGIGADTESEDFGAYYRGREDDFVSEYAATNVVEDFAETFAYTTLKDTSSYGGMAARKIDWMKQNAEISARMKEIKSVLATDLRARKIIQQ